jgi:phospholipase/carboxylesterase
MLHGRSGSEDAMWIFSKVIPDGWIVVAPRGIKPDPGGGYAWHPRKRDEWPPLSMFDAAVASLTHFIRALPELYNADPGQLYLMGFSQGAAVAYAVAMGYPGLVKGIVGLVGFVPVNSYAAEETTAMKDLPIFMAVGVDDPYIPLDRTQSCAETLRKSGALLAYHEYQTGHRLNAKGMRDLEGWLKERASKP